VPSGAEIGDVVVVFNGAVVPHLLRRTQENSKERWEIIGECWIDGIMDGEAMQMGQLVERTFEIC